VDSALHAQIEEANKLLSERKYDEVAQLVQPLLMRDTGGQAQRVFGMAQLGLGKYQEAVHILMTAGQMLPKDATVAFAYGNAMNLNGQSEGARASFERALNIDPTHPGAQLGYLNTSKSLADRDEPTDPMKAIEWLYGVWQRDVTNSEVANRILDIYLKNGWNDSARQFVDLFPPKLKNSEAVVAKMKTLPADAPPVNPDNIRPTATQTPSVVQNLEACPFCKQQIMVGVFQCPHCKMSIRAQVNMPGGNYKPEWQEVVLNIFCYIGIALGGFDVIMTFVNGTYNKTAGAYSLAIGFLYVASNIMIIQRNDTWMAVTKILHIINVMYCTLCACMSFGLIGSAYGATKQAMIMAFILVLVQGAYSTLMAYLLNYEGE
jgi:tetratricopeptide (TPR) repeat protein